jgi:mRNA interferase RelE/StbE
MANALPEAVVHAVAEFISGPLASNPQRVGKRLRPPLSHLHSARRGTFRILYELDEESRTVVVTAIQHRADVYRT